MKYYSVESLARLCKVDRETIRRWRNRGVNGVKLDAKQTQSHRGTALMFDEDAVRAFVDANPKYLTKELDASLNESRPANAMSTYDLDRNESENQLDGDGYVETMLENERAELLKKLAEIDRTLALIRKNT